MTLRWLIWSGIGRDTGLVNQKIVLLSDLIEGIVTGKRKRQKEISTDIWYQGKRELCWSEENGEQ